MIRFCDYQGDNIPQAPEGSILLVFECEPEQYAKAWRWTQRQWDKTTPLYRVLLPCNPERTAYDLCDFHLYNGTHFIGRFEHWSQDQSFEVIQINTEDHTKSDVWPFKSKHRLVDIEQQADCSPFLTPQLFSGLSLVQHEVLRVLETTTSLDGLVQTVAYNTRVPSYTVESQIDDLNRLLVRSRGKTITRIKFPVPPPFPLLMYMQGESVKNILDLYIAYTQGKPDWWERWPHHEWRCWYEGKVQRMDTYTFSMIWIPLYFKSLLREQLTWPDVRGRFIRAMCVQDVDFTTQRRKYWDETPAQKRIRVINEYGEQWADRLLAIPNCEIGQEAYLEEDSSEKKRRDGWNAKDEWELELTAFKDEH